MAHLPLSILSWGKAGLGHFLLRDTRKEWSNRTLCSTLEEVDFWPEWLTAAICTREKQPLVSLREEIP